MLIEILAIIFGILAGTFTGLIPGIHINLVAAIIISFPLAKITGPIPTIIFIVSMAIAHTFLDFIPSIFLGAPDEDTSFSVLPGHKMLLKGYGNHAMKLTLIGSSTAILIFILITPLFIWIIPMLEEFITIMIPFFLIWVLIFLIYIEKRNRVNALLILIISGFLGLASANLPIKEPLLPLLTGLFGSSIILISIKSKTRVPKQKIESIKINKKELLKPIISTTLVSPICSFLPGIGSNQAAVISSSIFKESTKEQFLILLGSINTLVMAISFVTLFLINKSRTGAASTVSRIIEIDKGILFIIILTIIVSSIISLFIAIKISKIISKNIHKVNYSKISILTLIIIVILVFIISGFLGFLVFIISTILGLLSTELETPKSFLMGSLIIPTIIYYL